jgi:hypothetical protein
MPETANERLQSLTIAHATYLERYKRDQVRQIVALLNDELEPAVVAKLEARLERIKTRGFDTGMHTTQRLRDLKASIDAEIAAFAATAHKVVKTELLKVAKQEAIWQVNALEKVVPPEVAVLARVEFNMPAPETLRAIVNEGPINGALLKDWFKNVEDNAKRAVTKAVNVGLSTGETTAQIVARVRGTKALGYADGAMQGTRAQINATVSTAVGHTTSAARAQASETNKDILKGEKWSATLDSSTCPRCSVLDGKVFELGEGPTTPEHVNCLPGDSRVLSWSGIAAASARLFDGELFTIETARGRKLTCTPNHPILTPSGYVAARFLDVGSYVVGCRVGEWERSADGNGEHVPTRIDHVAETLLADVAVVAEPVPVSGPDFHGDGHGSQVAVVGSYSALRNGVDAALCKHGRKSRLVVGAKRSDTLPRRGSLEEGRRSVFHSAHGGVSLLCQSTALMRRGSGHAAELLLGPVADVDSPLAQDAVYERAGGAEPLRYAERPDPGKVEVDYIVDVRRRDYFGHVYNLQTGSGFYVAGGIVTHNCRCVRIPVVKSWEELGIKGPKLPAGTRASMDGQVPADLTFDQWLKKQTPDRVADVLGSKAAAKAYLAGEVPLSAFSTSMGSVLSWKQVLQRGT